LPKQQSIKKHLNDFCSQRNYMLYFDSEGKANIKSYWYSQVGDLSPYYSDRDVQEGTRELDEGDFLEFHAYKDASHVVNQVQTVYQYCPYGNLYSYFGEIACCFLISWITALLIRLN